MLIHKAALHLLRLCTRPWEKRAQLEGLRVQRLADGRIEAVGTKGKVLGRLTTGEPEDTLPTPQIEGSRSPGLLHLRPEARTGITPMWRRRDGILDYFRATFRGIDLHIQSVAPDLTTAGARLPIPVVEYPDVERGLDLPTTADIGMLDSGALKEGVMVLGNICRDLKMGADWRVEVLGGLLLRLSCYSDGRRAEILLPLTDKKQG